MFDELLAYLLDAVQYVSFNNTKHPIYCEQEMKLQTALQVPGNEVALMTTSNISCVPLY